MKNKNQLIRAITNWWNAHKNDLDYCNKKFDHLPRVIDMCIAMAGRATGLKKMSKLKLKLENFYLKYLFINNFKKH